MEDRSPLLPDRHPQQDLFVCDIVDAVPKGDMSSMEHPIFSLSTKPDMRPRRYERSDNWIEISPSRYGIATVHDRDVLIYCISQCMAALNEGRKVHRSMRFKAYDLLVATNRQTSGRGYELLKDALRRLQGTQIETNLRQGRKGIFQGFRSHRLRRDRPRNPRRKDARRRDHAFGMGVRRHREQSRADAQPPLFLPAQAAGATALRARPQALRDAGRVEDRTSISCATNAVPARP